MAAMQPTGAQMQNGPAEWWPSEFGPDDQIGMLNHITEAKRVEAMSLVRSGRLYDLAHVLDEKVPVFPGRHFKQTLVTTAHHQNVVGSVTTSVNWVICVASATEQLGTHLDGLNHLQIGERAYNGHTISSIGRRAGARTASAPRRSRRSSRAAGSLTCRASSWDPAT